MDSSKRRAGRPKASAQTGPLVLEGNRARVKIELEIASVTADDLKEYTRWVELSSSLTTAEATFSTVDYALREVFRRDRLWKESRRQRERPAIASSTASPPARASSLPPPASSGRAAPTPTAPPGNRASGPEI
jgi:hypothetical protein